MPRKALLLAGVSSLLVLSAALVYFVLQKYLEQPMQRIYQVLSRTAELAPQDWIWAAIIGLFVLISLRSLSTRREARASQDPYLQHRPEGLEAWLKLLQERSRGGYFRWRLANQLAEFAARIGDPPNTSSNKEVREYLKHGRIRRTIQTGTVISADSTLIDAVVTHLEELEHET